MKILIRLMFGLLGMITSLGGLAAVEVGQVTYSRGVLTGQLDGEQPRLIAKGSLLHNGETLNTGDGASINDAAELNIRAITEAEFLLFDLG